MPLSCLTVYNNFRFRSTEYVLVTQDQQHVERRRRTATGDWETQFSGFDQTIKLESIGLEFAIAALYRGLDG